MFEGLIVACAFAAAGFVHTAAGFGSALVSMPIMTLVIGVHVATPLQALLALPISFMVFRQNRMAFRWAEALPIILASLVGVPLGARMLTTVPAAYVIGTLGLLLTGFAIFELFVSPRRLAAVIEAPERSRAGWRRLPGKLAAGFTAGVLGGAYATNGPPLIVYGMLRRWDKELFRSVLQSVFFINGIAIIFWHAMEGLITFEVGTYLWFGAPGMALGIVLGRRVDQRMDAVRFRRAVLVLLLALGISLLLRASTVG